MSTKIVYTVKFLKLSSNFISDLIIESVNLCFDFREEEFFRRMMSKQSGTKVPENEQGWFGKKV